MSVKKLEILSLHMLWLSSVSAVRHLSVTSVSELCEGPTVSAALAVLSSVFVIRGAVSKPGGR